MSAELPPRSFYRVGTGSCWIMCSIGPESIEERTTHLSPRPPALPVPGPQYLLPLFSTQSLWTISIPNSNWRVISLKNTTGTHAKPETGICGKLYWPQHRNHCFQGAYPVNESFLSLSDFLSIPIVLSFLLSLDLQIYSFFSSRRLSCQCTDWYSTHVNCAPTSRAWIDTIRGMEMWWCGVGCHLRCDDWERGKNLQEIIDWC